jgi:hypothetical protein
VVRLEDDEVRVCAVVAHPSVIEETPGDALVFLLEAHAAVSAVVVSSLRRTLKLLVLLVGDLWIADANIAV